MTRKWQVVAVYAPRPRLVQETTYYQKTVKEVIPPGAGMEWKFTVSGVTAVEAIEAFKRSGFFCGELVKQFGFTVEEKVE